MSEVDAGKIAADIVELYEPVAEEQGALFQSSLEEGLMARGNRELLGRMLVNLVDNALKYGAGDDKPSVLVTARRVGGSIEICVADRGPGVPPQDRERVIDRFVRLENSRSRPGSGLGLSLAAAVARLHHGSLRLEDNTPGLRAVVSLPSIGSSRG
jgi:signal transduction histidine kinase